MAETYRQGDILFIRINEIPDGATIVKSGVIAKGSATSHTHRLHLKQGRKLFISDNISYIMARYPASILHEEHETIVLPSGCWRIQRQREYEPAGWRQVID